MQPHFCDRVRTLALEINLINIPNPHVDGMLLVHVVKDNIVWVTDLVSPRGGPIGRNPGTVAAAGNYARGELGVVLNRRRQRASEFDGWLSQDFADLIESDIDFGKLVLTRSKSSAIDGLTPFHISARLR
ncbi:MAG TPA: hypothetical protein VK148_14640 [Xanthobacteraceae bacterium]|jgi:hypothetical protein|nr:hypothetical protein [Xanthobacteraceae bacterium]